MNIHPEELQSFYSFRHSFRDALRRCNAPADTLQAPGGWSQSPDSNAGKVTSSDYGNKTAADLQRAWIVKVSYPGLDLSRRNTFDNPRVRVLLRKLRCRSVDCMAPLLQHATASWLARLQTANPEVFIPATARAAAQSQPASPPALAPKPSLH